jgi:hypothetical protein
MEGMAGWSINESAILLPLDQGVIILHGIYSVFDLPGAVGSYVGSVITSFLWPYLLFDSLKYIVLEIFLTTRVLFLILIILIVLLLVKIYEKPKGFVVLPFQVSTSGISGEYIADLLVAELLRIAGL